VLVVAIVDGGPAARAGLREGDVIVEVDGTGVARVDDIHRLLTDQQIGRAIAFAIVRGGVRKVVRVTPVEQV
jgi:S1-C subfamily serine protease